MAGIGWPAGVAAIGVAAARLLQQARERPVGTVAPQDPGEHRVVLAADGERDLVLLLFRERQGDQGVAEVVMAVVFAHFDP